MFNASLPFVPHQKMCTKIPKKCVYLLKSKQKNDEFFYIFTTPKNVYACTLFLMIFKDSGISHNNNNKHIYINCVFYTN